MDVTEIGQGRGVVHATARVGGGHHPPARGPADARPQPSDPNGAAGSPADVAPLFDANGDGVVERWSYAYGGDSFTSFVPPPSGSFGSDVASPHRNAESPPAAPDSAAARPGGHAPAHAGTPVALRHATHAYHADGGAIAPAPATPPAAPGAPAVTLPSPGPAPRR